MHGETVKLIVLCTVVFRFLGGIQECRRFWG